MFKTPMLIMAVQYLNVAYIWGGNEPITGLDCSGFVLQVLRDVGYKKGDMTSQGLYNELSLISKSSEIETDSILFFGRSISDISHVAIAINREYMIGASGGDENCTKLNHAITRDARVKITKIKSRRDLVASLRLP